MMTGDTGCVCLRQLPFQTVRQIYCDVWPADRPAPAKDTQTANSSERA